MLPDLELVLCLWAKFIYIFFAYRQNLLIPYCYQVVQTNGVDPFTNGVRIISADRFLLGLN